MFKAFFLIYLLILIPFLILISWSLSDKVLEDPTNHTPIKFTLGSDGFHNDFEIPQHYFEFEPHSKTVNEFTLELRLPDLVPESVAAYKAQQDELTKEEQNALGQRFRLRVIIKASKDYREMNNLQTSVLPDEVKESANFEQIYGLLDLGTQKKYVKEERGYITLFEGFRSAGIRFFKTQQGEVIESLQVGVRHYVPTNLSGKEGFYIVCSMRDQVESRTYCRIKKDIGSNIHVEIGFSAYHFPDWKIVDKKVTDFLILHMKN